MYPTGLKYDLFTTASVDNIDHNPSSNTAMSCFHGTVVQHPTQCKLGRARELTTPKTEKENRRVQQLPSLYANVPPCFVSISRGSCRPPEHILLCEVPQDTDQVAQKWLDHLSVAMLDACQRWAAFNTTDSRGCAKLITPMEVMPLFIEKAESLAMMYHSMNVGKAVMEHLNTGQIPALVADAPYMLS
ncbi:hypothetical protein PR048_013791 [Dryococelus australis]|uniref:PH domain-containing protein n=1 Tax=Dryococelus australis TaxID=614101 RepID=A0ABQ9HU08_9NEOP|nr:hypothetical protein PR048_013791 [Dryococelus australis]